MTRPGECASQSVATGRVCSPESPVDERATDGGTNTQRRQRRRKNVQQPSTINHQPPLLSRGGLVAILDVGAARGEIAIQGVFGGGVVCAKLFGQRA